MATIPIKCILTIFLAFTICCSCQLDSSPVDSSSWAKLQISPVSLSSMEYGNFLVEIYEHANNHKATTIASQKKYFYSPIALLDHKSAASTYNRATKQPEMRFQIEMWNDKVQNEVVKHLNKIVGQEIQSDKVRVIPLEKVILTSKIPTADYSLSPVWTTYDKSKTLRLSLSCFDQKICDELANEMLSDPEHFDHFKLLYSLSSQTSQTKQTTINIESVTSGQMISNLLQKFGDKKEVFLTANDEKKMLTETATNIRMDTFDDSEVGSPDTESQIYNILKELLVTSREIIKEQSDKMWDSVFWNEDNYRPDRTTKTLNEIITKLDTETQKKLTDMFQKAEKQLGIVETFSSSNKDEEKKGEKQLRRENETKDANENEMKLTLATDQERFSSNKINDEKSTTNEDNIDAGVHSLFVGKFEGKFQKGNNGTHNSNQQNEKRELDNNYLDGHNRNLENKERIQHNYDANSWADVDRISSVISEKMSNDSDSSRRVEILKEDVEKLLHESRNHVEWDGDKFVPKPMQLSRINLAKFRDSQSFQDRNVRIRYTHAELSAQIKFMEHAKLTVTDEWNNLKDELKATAELLKSTVNNLVTMRIDMTNKLEETKQELEKTKADLSKTAIDLLTELNATKKDLENSKSDFNTMRTFLTKTLDATEKELTEIKITNKKLSTELKATSQQLGHELKLAEENLRKELKDYGLATSNKLNTTATNLNIVRTELKSTNTVVADLTTKLNSRTSEIVDIGKIPTSCEDLHQMGHKISGIFLVKGSKKIEIIYCYFYPNQKLQKWIGYADIKSAPVHFYVQRSSPFIKKSIPIPFDIERTNEGNAMNLTSGIFTAPQTGTYFFSFAGVANFSPSFYRATFEICLVVNGDTIGTGMVSAHHSITEQLLPLTIQSTLNLKSGDKVWIHLTYRNGYSYLFDGIDHFTHFSGFLLEEEIVTSL